MFKIALKNKGATKDKCSSSCLMVLTWQIFVMYFITDEKKIKNAVCLLTVRAFPVTAL